MQLQHQKITLDVNDTRAFTVLNAHQGDSKTRFIDITLTESGNTITLSSNYVATVKASINSKTKAVNTAVVDATNNVVTVELTKTMLDTPGLLNCEVVLQDNQQFVTSATFTVKVAESVISDESAIVASQEFGKLIDALIEIKDIEDKADRVQTLVDNIDKLESANDIVTRLSNVESKETQLETQHKTDVQALTDKANSIVEQANTDRQNFNKSVDEVNANLDTKENVSNKVSVITHPSLDYYPDTKAVFDYVNSKLETPLSDIESLKSGKLDKTDFNSYKTSNDNAVNSKVDTTDFNTYKTATDKAIADLDKIQTATYTDVGKALIVKDVDEGKVVSWEFGAIGGTNRWSSDAVAHLLEILKSAVYTSPQASNIKSLEQEITGAEPLPVMPKIIVDGETIYYDYSLYTTKSASIKEVVFKDGLTKVKIATTGKGGIAFSAFDLTRIDTIYMTYTAKCIYKTSGRLAVSDSGNLYPTSDFTEFHNNETETTISLDVSHFVGTHFIVIGFEGIGSPETIINIKKLWGV